MAKHNEIGAFGEDQAAFFLENDGYEILAKNYRHQKGEIDLIAFKKPFVCFIEVKMRSSNLWGDPESAIDEKKEKLLVATANAYLESHDIDEMARFDVISIVGDEKNYELKHIKDAIHPDFE